MSHFLLLIALIIQSGCFSTPQNKRKTIADGTTDTTANDPDTPTFAENYDVKWYSGGDYRISQIVNESPSTVIYLGGKSVHEYFEMQDSTTNKYNYQKNYCLVFDFKQSAEENNLELEQMQLALSRLEVVL